MALENDQINRIRIEAHKRYGYCRIIRLRLMDGSLRIYVALMKDNRILTILAGGTSEQEIMSQL